jgi:hypothetical protein
MERIANDLSWMEETLAWAMSSVTISLRESKRDSSAMKAIAVLTMFFLPGTFVAVSQAHP